MEHYGIDIALLGTMLIARDIDSIFKGREAEPYTYHGAN